MRVDLERIDLVGVDLVRVDLVRPNPFEVLTGLCCDEQETGQGR